MSSPWPWVEGQVLGLGLGLGCQVLGLGLEGQVLGLGLACYGLDSKSVYLPLWVSQPCQLSLPSLRCQ